MTEAPIFRFNSQRDRLVQQTVDRVVETTADPLFVLNDAAYHETRRLDGTKRPKDLERLEDWRNLARALGRMSDGERRSKLREIATVFRPGALSHSFRHHPPPSASGERSFRGRDVANAWNRIACSAAFSLSRASGILSVSSKSNPCDVSHALLPSF